MKNNYDPTVPCHRVIRSDGRAGEYNRGGEAAKRELLRKEGVWKLAPLDIAPKQANDTLR